MLQSPTFKKFVVFSAIYIYIYYVCIYVYTHTHIYIQYKLVIKSALTVFNPALF